MKKVAFLSILTSILLISCMPDDSQGNNGADKVNLTFKVKHHWDNTLVTKSDFGELIYTNQNQDVQSITLLKYLISNITLHTTDGTSVKLKDYHLFNAEQDNTMFFNSDVPVPTGSYNKITFTFGFNEEDNAQNYPDLNTTNWNWPEMLGGGYHFMQLEGNYSTDEGPQPYAYHYGTARASEGVFEANHFVVEINENFTITSSSTLEVKMNIAEWFKNPHTWNLHEYNTDLMGNYEAQIMMRQNGATVFGVE